MPDDGRPVVAVLGAIGPDKGARRLERLVELTRAQGLRLRWVLIGYLDRGRGPWQSPDGVFTMHGPYDSRVLPELFEQYRAACRVSLGRAGNIQLHAVRSMGGGTTRDRATGRCVGGSRCRKWRGLGAER
jgi:hypothetical protein